MLFHNRKIFIRGSRFLYQFIPNLTASLLFFYFIFSQGSRGGLFTLSVLLLFLTKPYVRLKQVFYSLSRIVIRKSYIFNSVTIITLLSFMLFLVNAFNKRAFLFFTYFLDPESVYKVSSGTLMRSQWYSSVLDINSLAQSVDLFHSPSPVWGNYPHNFLLDTAGNIGLIISFFSIIGFFLSIRFFRAYLSFKTLPYVSLCIIVVGLGSLVSGTIWDYYFVFAGLSLLFVKKNSKQTFST